MSFGWSEFLAAWTSQGLWEGARTTMILAIVSWSISLVLALPLALAKTSSRHLIARPATVWVWLFRGIPLLVLLIFVYNAVPELVPGLGSALANPFIAGLVALVLSESAYMAEAVRTGLLAVEEELRDAGRALGFGPMTLQRIVVLPIALRVSVPALGNEFVSNLKNTSLVSVISLVELTLAGQRLYSTNFAVIEVLTAVAMLYLIAVTLFSALQRQLEHRLGRHTDMRSASVVTAVDTPTLSSEMLAEVDAVPPSSPTRTAVSEEIVLEAKELGKTYGSQQVLRDVSLKVHRGEVCVLLGRSGSGKSTLLRCLNRLIEPDTGVVEIDGSPLGYAPSRSGELRPLPERMIASHRRELGMVFQRFNLFPHLTAVGNVAVAPRHHGLFERGKDRDYALPFLRDVGLEPHADKYPGQLSGGQQQRVAIARALALRPNALLLDEPTSALDPELVGEVLQVVQQLAAAGRTMVIVTHELRFARLVADTIVFMEDGHVREVTPAEDFFSAPRSDAARRFVSSGDDR